MKNFYLLSMLFLLSCSNDNKDEINETLTISMNHGISYLNKEGKDLLNPKTEGNFEYHKIKFYYHR